MNQPKKLRFLVIGPVYPFRGGIAHYTAMLAQAFREQFEVTLVSFIRQYPKWLYPGTSDRDPSQSGIGFPAEYLLDPLNPITWEKTVRYIRGKQPDMVEIQWWTTFWAPAYAYLVFRLKQSRIKVIYTIHNVLPHEAKFFDRWLARLALRQAAAFIVLSEGQKQKLQTLIPKAQVFQSALPTYQNLASANLSKTEVREKYQLPVSQAVILFFGIVRPYKGLRYLLEAVALLKDDGKPVHLLVAGEFWEDYNDYVKTTERLAITDCVRFENRYIPNEELASIFDASDLFIAPYTGGTQSAAVKLALSFGLPSIVTDVIVDDSLKDLAQVTTVPAGDAQALASAIQKVLQSGTGRTSPSENQTQEIWTKLFTFYRRLQDPSDKPQQYEQQADF